MQHICAQCRQPLSQVRHSDGRAEWRHGVEPTDHPAAPVPRIESDERLLRPVCDFCMSEGSPDDSWIYPTIQFEVRDETGHAWNIDDGEGWGACHVCHGLIESGACDALAARSATLAERRHGRPYDEFVVHVRAAHGAFFAARTGPGIPAREFLGPQR